MNIVPVCTCTYTYYLHYLRYCIVNTLGNSTRGVCHRVCESYKQEEENWYVDDSLQPCAHTKKTPIDYTGPQDNPNITEEKLYETVHNQLPNACHFTIVRDRWSTSESLTSPCIDDR